MYVLCVPAPEVHQIGDLRVPLGQRRRTPIIAACCLNYGEEHTQMLVTIGDWIIIHCHAAWPLHVFQALAQQINILGMRFENLVKKTMDIVVPNPKLMKAKVKIVCV